jgi:hypothetical protein
MLRVAGGELKLGREFSYGDLIPDDIIIDQFAEANLVKRGQILLCTEEQAKYYGSNTKWCTSGDDDNLFDMYNSQGPLYVLISRANEKNKFQIVI